jgi:hypothetical protein
LAVLCGALVGFTLGLIGGGGSIMATPLLLYVVGLQPHVAIQKHCQRLRGGERQRDRLSLIPFAPHCLLRGHDKGCQAAQSVKT